MVVSGRLRQGQLGTNHCGFLAVCPISSVLNWGNQSPCLGELVDHNKAAAPPRRRVGRGDRAAGSWLVAGSGVVATLAACC